MKKVIHIISALISINIFLLGLLLIDYDLLLLSILLLLVGNLFFGLTNVRYILFFIFNICMFVFLISRPFVSMMRGGEWWQVGSEHATLSALISLYLSLFFMYIGAFCLDKIILIKTNDYSMVKDLQPIELEHPFMKNLQNISMIIFYIAVLASFIEGWEKIIFMQSHTYTQYYISYQTSQNFIVKGLIQLMKPSLCIFLATMPNKNKALLPLSLFLISTLPQLFVGMRSPTMLAFAFIFSYFFLRDVYKFKESKRWIGKIEKLVIVISIPLLMAFLYGYNYWRTGRAVELFEGNLITNFLYQQGISFDVLVQGFDVMNLLPENKFPGYMFGPIYDNVIHNSLIGRLLFDTVSINNQSLDALALGHDMKAHLSFVLMGNNYLQGAGVGVVHILEVIHDIGWIGLIFYNLILGAGMVKMVDWFGLYNENKWVLTTLVIYALLQLFYTPRSDAIYMIAPIFSPYFWICVFVCYLFAKAKMSWKKI
ncbi:O-antigen polysaccharide polymerase Wzy family protein [Paenibacillus sp. FSL P2-0136]|uniref:O-antigen polysaccharide polymerase Wzy family protein n=1 Tax=unclassified Paenibacillus TaxID=185978 RepID=UPI0030DAD02F